MTKTRYSEDHEKDRRSSADVVREYRNAVGSDVDVEWPSLAMVHYRGGAEEFKLGELYASSGDPVDRIVGADILAQLGWGDKAFQNESAAILIRLLGDEDPRVIAAAAMALGHRKSAAAISRLLPLATHSDERIRLGVVNGLSCQEAPEAIACLARLCSDTDPDVRNWAAFGIGSLSEADSPLIREALLSLLDDPDAEIRGEALIGLAKRQDPCVKAPLVRELGAAFEGSWCLEAAELLADRDLLPLLEDLQSRLPGEDLAKFGNDLRRAIEACGGKRL